MKFRLNRPLVSVVTTVALLLALVAGVAQFRDRAPSAVPAAPASSVAASQGDYQLSPPNEAEPAVSAGETSSAAPAAPARDYASDLGTDHDPFVIASSQPRCLPAASAPVAICAEVYHRNDRQYPDCADSAVPDPVEDRPGQPAVPADSGINPGDFLSGGEGAGVLVSPTPDAAEDPGTACRQSAGCNR